MPKGLPLDSQPTLETTAEERQYQDDDEDAHDEEVNGGVKELLISVTNEEVHHSKPSKLGLCAICGGKSKSMAFVPCGHVLSICVASARKVGWRMDFQFLP